VPAAEAVRTGLAIELDPQALAERYPGAASWRRLAGSGPFVALPLRLDQRTLGALAVRMAPERPFEHGDRLLLEVLSRTCAQALARAETVAAERAARDRTDRQYAVAAALAHALTPADVAQATLAEVVDAVGAEQGTVWQLSEDGHAVHLIGARGFSDDELAAHRQIALRDPRMVPDAIRTRAPVVFDAAADADAAYPDYGGGFVARGLESVLAVPLTAGGRAVGGLLLSAVRPHAFGADERALTAALAAQAGQALERARLFEAERRVSVTLQRSLLPDHLPEIPGVQLAVRYLAAAGLEAGGDFYEALPLPGGAVGIAVGDVVGRGASAAAAMGQLRSALRAFALTGEGPGGVLERLSGFAETVGGAMAATAVVGHLDPATGDLRYACAGHPWPLLVHAVGETEFLREGRGVPLACVPQRTYREASATLRQGSTLLLYTDGLTERRGREVEQVLEDLRAAAGAAAGRPLKELLDAAVAGTGDVAPADDVALVAVRLTAAPGPSPA
jgi:serine phosphatase RsbU (regulator of sigma subunit)